ncbi:helix-turn-helix domain-containing protein [Alcaligenes faecalis]|uniref:Helix-turn-helix domain-containing protein n=1 Tax=Alcaligenes faecalis TaxID=511 RepID=A0AAE9KNR6_ALCFA|nr:helix-turn-helix domain-containing protein [Alcaligenes faecalis]UPL20211.1 helix-turn-helix domain-containing protein [Alcaligenes faecalis]
MSTIIMSECWPLQGMTPAQKAVLISLADNANDQGVCWPSVESISARTCLSERSVQNAIKWLIDAGALQAQQRQGRSTVYTVTPAAFAPPQEMRGANKDETPANNDRTPAAFAPIPAAAAPRTVKEPSRNRKEPQKKISVEVPGWLDADAWSMWDEFRKQKSGKAWTDAAKRLSLRTLEKLYADGHDPAAAVEQSIERGWTGIFPVKDSMQTGQSSNGFDPLAYVNRNRKRPGDDDVIDV